MTRRILLATMLAAGVLGFAFAGARAASAASTKGPSLEVSVIEASRTDAGPGSVDPRIGGDLPHDRPPFNGYNVFKLIDRKPFPLDATRPVAYALPNGRMLTVGLDGVTEDAGEKRYAMHAQIQDYLQGLKVVVSAREPFWLGGQSYAGGTLLIELKVLP